MASKALCIVSILLVFSAAMEISGEVVESHFNPKNKCTPKDTRQTYPRCMQYSVDKAVWCDQSNYTRIPDPDKMLTYKSCRDASALYINDSCLHEIKKGDLEKYKLIKSFKCGRNYIKELTDGLFVHNKKLHLIDFFENRIEVIGQDTFTGLRDLEVLNLGNNLISEIPSTLFRHTASLTEISFHNNKIQVLEWGVFFGLTKLKVLRLTGNKIKHIVPGSFNGLESLTHLHLDQNGLDKFASGVFDDLPGLQVLTASHNGMLKWPELGTLSHLHTINFAFNYIGELKSTHIVNMSKLQNLSLENNSLSSFSDDLFRNATQLRYLNVGDNDIGEIGRHTFSRLCHLETLVLRGNGLKTPHAEWFENMIRNGVLEGTDIGGNEWKCECSAVQYAGFLEALKKKEQANPGFPAWSKTLQIICDYPKKHKGELLDDRIKSRLVHQSRCPEVAFRTAQVACNASSTFVRTTETFEYSTVTPVHSESTKSATTAMKFAIFKEKALPDIGAMETATDVPLVIMVLLIIAFVVGALVMTVRCLIRSRKSEKMKDFEAVDRKVGQDGTGKESLRDSRSDCTLIEDAYDHLQRDQVTECHETRLVCTLIEDAHDTQRDQVTKCHETRATPAIDAMSRVATINSGYGGSILGEEKYTSMHSLHGPTENLEGDESQETPLLNTAQDTIQHEKDETRPKECVGGFARQAELRLDPDGASLTSEVNQSMTVPKQLSGNAVG